MTTAEKIQKKKEEYLEAKKEEEMKRLDSKLNREEKDVEKILEMVHDTLLYKDVSGRLSTFRKYAIVTEEMFLADYTTVQDCGYSMGINWTSEEQLRAYPSVCVVSVNGNNYYDIRRAVERYRKDIDNMRDKVTAAEQRLNEVEEEYKRVVEEFPEFVKMVKAWVENNFDKNGDY